MKPSIFNTDMVRAILDGRKTQTRRRGATATSELVYRCSFETPSAPYKKGDIIYVRETWCYGKIVGDCDGYTSYEWVEQTSYEEKNKSVLYKADMEAMIAEGVSFEDILWKPSIHMPKEYARLFLRVKDIRVERLNEISEEDCIKEGILQMRDGDDRIWFYPTTIDPLPLGNNTIFYKDYSRKGSAVLSAIESFKSLWVSIDGNSSFNDDYVWVIEFEKISKEEI